MLKLVVAALTLGVIWASWHLPMFFVRDSRQQGSFVEFAVVVVAWTLIMGALLSRANSSFLPALLFHWSANVCAYISSSAHAQMSAPSRCGSRRAPSPP